MGLKVIKLQRHAITEGNAGIIDPQSVGDFSIDLHMPLAQDQCFEAGRKLGPKFIRKALKYRSPYLRTRRTSELTIEGAGLAEELASGKLRFYEDPDLREVEHGYGNVDEQEAARRLHGWFYYRFLGGESPAECHTRLGAFLDSFRRQVRRKKSKKAWIVTHGLTLRCFVMRWLHLTVEQFNTIATPHNCDIITIARKKLLDNPQFVCGKWGVTGLRFRDKPQ